MQRFFEIILGLRSGFLSREGEFALSFNPTWPWQKTVGAGTWNFLLAALALALVIYVYRREGRARPARITLGVMRGLLLAMVIALLNRPVITLGQSRTEPSVLAVLVDDSLSMRIRDAAATAGAKGPQTRLAAAIDLLAGENQKLIRDLSRVHQLRFYRFDATAAPVAATTQPSEMTQPAAAIPGVDALTIAALQKLEPVGQSTQLGASLRAALDDLQGQRIAGVVLLTDGRDTPARPLAAMMAQLKDSGVKVFPVPIGSEQAPSNIEIQSVVADDAAFKGDIVNVRAMVRATGVGASREVTLRLKDKKTGHALTGVDGMPVEQHATLQNDAPTEVELQFKPDEPGTLDLLVEAEKQPGELDEEDNLRRIQIEVLDAKIAVLYVEGYPRWEYRYLKNEMIRDHSVNISCYLTGADPNFAQEGDPPDPKSGFIGPVHGFPESMDELLTYDVVIFGDVDPQQFSDAQLQLVSDFVSKKSGGFGMIAGPQFSPLRYRNTPIEAILPVDITHVLPEDPRGTSITQGFRLVLTKEGANSSIFRFFADKARNEKFVREDLQQLFWYCRGVKPKRGVGEVLAEHPSESDADGRRAALLVLGHFGGGRTLFSGIDDSWRWRFYTGESIFDTYWVQQLRYLARSKKLGQRRLTFVSSRPTYELGQQVRATLRILDAQLLPQLPEQIRVEVRDAGNDQVLRQETLVRQEGNPDTYNLSFAAERAGRFVVRLPAIAGGIDPIDLPVEVGVPKLELAQPEVDRTALNRLASETSGQLVEAAQARSVLPGLIPSAAKMIPLETSEPLWDAPLAMILFVLLITGEWVLRKVYGML